MPLESLYNEPRTESEKLIRDHLAGGAIKVCERCRERFQEREGHNCKAAERGK